MLHRLHFSAALRSLATFVVLKYILSQWRLGLPSVLFFYLPIVCYKLHCGFVCHFFCFGNCETVLFKARYHLFSVKALLNPNQSGKGIVFFMRAIQCQYHSSYCNDSTYLF